MKTSLLTTNTHTLDTSRNPMKRNTTQHSEKKNQSPAQNTCYLSALFVDVPSAWYGELITV